MSPRPPLPVLLVDREGTGPVEELGHESMARVWHIFGSEELEALPAFERPEGNALRLYRLDLLDELEARGLGDCPVILSHLVDLADVELAPRPAGLAVEVASAADLRAARATPADALIGRGLEAPGPARELSALVLFQLLRREADRPFWMHGYTGPELLQAYLAEGAAGVVLPPDQFRRRDSLNRYRFDLGGRASLRLEVPGGETEIRLLAGRLEEGAEPFLRATLAEGRWAEGMEDLGAGEARERLLRLLALAEAAPRQPPCDSCFREGSLYGRRHGLRYPIVQGPMSRVAVRADFARAIEDAGAFPYVAAAGLPFEELEALLRELAGEGRRFGVGLVTITESDEGLERLIALLEEVRPERVLVAAPRIDHLERLMQTGLTLWVHAPTASMFRSLRAMGLARFVVEGEEAGGHVSTTSSLTAWQEVLEEARRDPHPEELDLVFAGGIQGVEAAGLLSSLLHFHGLAGRLSVALQLGTAYLATPEALALTPLGEAYHRRVVEGEETTVTGETLKLRVRQVATPSVEKLRRQEWEVFLSDDDLETKRARIEAGYHGSLGRALAGDEEGGAASYMAGAAVALIHEATPVVELHRRLVAGRGAPAAPSGRHEPVAVIGLGNIFPGSERPVDFMRAILRKRCFIRDVPDEVWERDLFLSPDRDEPLRTYSGVAGLVGEVPFPAAEFRIPPSVAAQMDRAQRFALLAARDALADAGYLERDFDRERVAVMIANSMGGNAVDESQQTIHGAVVMERLQRLAEARGMGELYEELVDAYHASYQDREITGDSLPGELSSIIAGRVAWFFDLHGPNFTIDSACASSLAAVSVAVNSLRLGECDMVLAGGVDTQVDPGLFVKFSKLTALSGTGSFPFDARGDGFVIGEGCGVFLLKRYADALRDGDRVYALIRSVGSSSDGAGKGITAPNPDGQLKALRRAYEDAGVDPRELAFLECHGTGTPVGDAVELGTVERLVRGEATPGGAAEPPGDDAGSEARAPLPVGSVKAMVGHLKAAAGAVGLMKGVLAVNARVVPPQVGFEEPSPRLDWERSGLRVPRRPEPIECDPVVVGVSSFGFGGTNFHAVLTSPPAGARPPLVDPQDYLLPEVPGVKGETAFLFPGQGSQYVGMLAALRDDHRTGELLERADAVFQEIADRPLSAVIYPPPPDDESARAQQEAELRDTAVAQPAIFTASAILLRMVRDLGLGCDMVIGHSLGEYTALYAAGVLEFEDALRAVSIRGRLMAEGAGEDPGAMAFVAVDSETAAEMVGEVQGYLVPANLNAYEQTVVSGETSAVEALVELAGSRGIAARRLHVSRAFHSRLVEGCIPTMREALEKATLRYPEVPIPANLRGQMYPRPAEVAAGSPMLEPDRQATIELLTQQIDHPVDWVRQVEVAYEAGIRRFVEVGPRNVLCRLITEILQGKPAQVLPLDHPRGDPRELLSALVEQLDEPVRIHRVPLPVRAVAARTPRAGADAVDATSGEAGIPASLEERVLSVVARVSGYDPGQIGPEDDFERDLGIDTLKIFEIFSRLRGNVLPGEVQNFRELTSVARLVRAARDAGARDGGAAGATASAAAGVAAASGARGVAGAIAGADPGASHGPVDDRIRTYRLEVVHRGSVVHDRPVPEPYGFRVFLDDDIHDKHRLLKVCRQLEDASSRNFLVIQRLPATSRELCDRSIPDLHETILQCLSTQEGPQEELDFHLVTLSTEETFHQPAFRAIQGFVKSAQKDFPNLSFAYHHLDELAPTEERLRQVLVTPSLGRRVRADGSVEEDRLTVMDVPTASPGELARHLGPDDVVLVTGGARGVTARIVQSLLEHVESRFLLVGRTSHVDDWIQDDPRVTYLRADLRDPEAVRRLRLGARGVTLLIHAAGYEVSRNLREKPSYEVAQVLGVKIRGLEFVLDWLDFAELKGVVAFSSVAALFGNHGQADYAAANGFLNGTPRAPLAVLSIAWSAWADVGMAARGRVNEILHAQGIRFLEPEEGCARFQDLLVDFLRRREPGNLPVAVFGGMGRSFVLPGDRLLERARTTLDSVPLVLDGDRATFTYRFDLRRSPYLRDHRINESYYLPAVSVLRQFVKKSVELQEVRDLCFEDVKFLSPVVFQDGEEKSFSIEHRGDEYVMEVLRGRFDTPVTSLSLRVNQLGEDERLQADAAVTRLTELAAEWLVPYEPAPHPVPASEIYKTYFHGPAFQVMEELERYTGWVLVGKVDLEGEARRDTPLTEFGRVPYLLEAVFHNSGLLSLIDVDCGYYYIPHGIGRLDVLFDRCLEAEEAWVLSEIREVQERMRFDCVVTDGEGRALMRIEDLVMAKSREEVPHRKAILMPSSPVLLGGAEIMLVDLDEAADWGRERAEEIYTPGEREEIEEVRAEKRKREKFAGKLAAKILAREVVRRELRQSYGLETFEVRSPEQPVSVSFLGAPHLDQVLDGRYFSISHTAGLAVAAVARSRVGVDVERLRELRPETIERICGPSLQEDIEDMVARFHDDERLEALYRLALPLVVFTQKEAILKAAGVGISGGLSDVEVGRLALSTPVEGIFRGERYRVLTVFDETHVLTVARLVDERPAVGVAS